MGGCKDSKPRHVLASLGPFLLAAYLTAAQENIFHVDGRRPHHAVVTVDASWDESIPRGTPMARLVAGVLAEYDTKTIGKLLRCATNTTAPTQAGQLTAVIHLSRADSPHTKQVELHHLADGTIVASSRLEHQTQRIVLDRRKFDVTAGDWPAFRGGFEITPDDALGGSGFAMPQPYIPAAITMTLRTMKQRLYAGMPVRTENADRDLNQETLHVRLPAGYAPRRRAGLLVWSSPSPRGEIPRVFHDALDEMSFVCVGIDNAGNDRDVPDKFQLIFDAVANARQRYHIDDERIYITGMSGGGKVSSTLMMCFPDLFRGAISIVGFGTYAKLDDRWGKHHYPYFAKPKHDRLQLAKSHRMALMGGPLDFNYEEMMERQKRLEADGFDRIRFLSFPDMAHQMPTRQRFLEALRWIDEPYDVARGKRAADAHEAMLAYLTGREDQRPTSERDRAAIVQLIHDYPWTDAAWKALELLSLGDQ
ncbi:MAG: prolyl oligopeptidase family serine peptidase [Phycisphaerales bacterium]